MFDSLSEKLQETLSGVRGRGALTEEDITRAMREIRLALLEADVNFKVVKQFTSSVKERCLGAEVQKQLNPGQQVVKIVNEELTALMGGASAGLAFSPRPPTVILMAGLQGSGKTTATAKLARFLREENGSSVGVAACDVYRPAAVEQLIKVGHQAGATVYERGTDADPVEIAAWARDQAERDGKDVLIVDTAGRLHIDEALMAELTKIKKAVRPTNVLLVVDAMTGQDAVNVAEQFAEAAQFDGVILSKLDGDARGGAALSVKAVTGKPILFASTGEKLENFERFHPDRMAQRILGMGDVLSFIEKAEKQVDEDEAKVLERKLRKNEFTLEDFLDQLQKIRKMGPLTSLLGMMPGLAGHQLSKMNVDERELDRVQAIITSMTAWERRHPEAIKGSRRLRIARGSGTSVQQVNQLVKQFGEMRKMMKGLVAREDAGPRRPDAPALSAEPGDHEDGAERLRDAERVAEREHARGHADDRLEVDERARQLGVHARLAVGVERERDQRADAHERAQRDRLLRRRRAHGQRRRQRGQQREQPGGGHLHGGHGDRVAALEQPALDHDQRRAQHGRGEHERVAGSDASPPEPATSATPPSATAKPVHAAGPATARPSERAAGRDEHGHGAEDQRRVRDARLLDPEVLQHDHRAVAERAPRGDPQRGGLAQRLARHERQHRRGEAEAHDREPGGIEPAEGELRERHGDAEHEAGGRQGEKGGAVHAVQRGTDGPATLRFDPLDEIFFTHMARTLDEIDVLAPR